jgi:hypothetical protein
MGFTPFVSDATLEAVTDMHRFLRENSDIVAQHIESVPWKEALDGKPFHENLTKDWEGRSNAIAPGAKVYLAVSPLNMTRSGLADYRAATEHDPLPPEFQGKAFDDPTILKAYLNYCQRAVEFFHPDFLAIGIEVNELYHHAPAQWEAYTRLHRHVYRELKKTRPQLPIFSTFTIHSMVDPSWKDRGEMLEAYKRLMEYNDVVAISFYPFFKNLSDKVDESFAWLTSHFDRFGKPYAVAETGESAETVSFESDGKKITLEGSPERQAAYYERLLRLAQAKKFKFVVSFLYKDYDDLWEKIKANSPAWAVAWRDCGFLDEKGNRRPAYAVWKRYLDMPVKP